MINIHGHVEVEVRVHAQDRLDLSVRPLGADHRHLISSLRYRQQLPPEEQERTDDTVTSHAEASSFYEKAVVVKWSGVSQGLEHHRRSRPFAMLLPALGWGSAPGDPVHDEIRPDAGAAIYESASTCRTIGARAVATRPGVSGAVRRWVFDRVPLSTPPASTRRSRSHPPSLKQSPLL